MKVAIVGRGIAGLTQGILLKNEGFQVTVFDRLAKSAIKGHAFLMNRNALELLESLPFEQKKELIRNKIDLFNLKSPDGKTLEKVSLDDWYCLKRVDLIQYLSSFYNSDEIKYAHEFSHFIYDKNGKAISVVFKNNATITADIFIGADGSNSAVRQNLFGPDQHTPIEVKEVVGISNYSVKSRLNVFQKIQSKNKGLSFGYIPLSHTESVWFMQYDVQLEKGYSCKTPDQLKGFCLSLLKEFPADVMNVLESNDFNNSYKWNTRDFDLLPSFHKKNVVLIGDAAHLSLPFTSSGTTDAILDAVALTKSFKDETTLEESFCSYYMARREELTSKLAQGRELKNYFLEPNKYREKKFILPLVLGK